MKWQCSCGKVLTTIGAVRRHCTSPDHTPKKLPPVTTGHDTTVEVEG